MRQARPSLLRDHLLEAIALEEARLAQLEEEQAETRGRLAAFRAELTAVGAEPEIRVHLPLPAELSVPKTAP